jgi:hypothetical protein
MIQNCTIYSSKSYEEILAYFESLKWRDVSDGVSDMEVPDKSDIEIKMFERYFFDETLLRISLKKEFERGDSFSHLILGTWNFFETIETEHEAQKKELTHHILACKTALGIRADPEFTLTDKRLDFVFELMEMFDGIIFNGRAMLDKKGRVILDKDGKSAIEFVGKE